MPIPTAKLAQRKAKLRCKCDGTTVTISWTEWPDGKPELDPTTGAYLTTSGGQQPVNHTADVRAFIHIVNPIQSQFRKFAEVTVGDAIVDFPLDLLRITDAGDTTLEVGEVVDEIAFSSANRSVENSALGDSIEPSDLEGVSMVFGGHTWVQKEVGEELASSWGSIYSGLNINRAMLMTTTK